MPDTVHRLGMLTPSSNTVLEPTTARMLSDLPDVTAHFARFAVTRIALGAEAEAQFDPAPILAAARLLADAHADVIAWNGTSGSWLGIDTDRRLCAAITAETGAPATTSTLAIDDALDAVGARSIGLVTPYTPDVQHRIVANYEARGITVRAERHLNDPGNYSFARFHPEQIAPLVQAVAASQPDAIVILCTNLRGARAVPLLEAALGIPVLDSIAVTLWRSLLLAGIDPARVQGWGRLFAHPVATRQFTPASGTPNPTPA